ncbi:MAG: RDD family protein [Phycisphaeraceae bacterium]
MAQTLPAGADDQNLWIVQTDADPPRLTVLHRYQSDEANLLRKAQTFNGRLVRHGVAAADGRLWLVFERHVIRQVQAVADQTTGRIQYQGRVEPSLLAGAVLRSLAATRDGPWALLRVEDRATLDQLDAEPPPLEPDEQADDAETAASDVEVDITVPQQDETPPRTDQSDSSAPTLDRAPSTTTDESAARLEAVREDRLVKLQGNRWVKVPLPDDWPDQGRSWLVTRRADDAYPLLVAVVRTEPRPLVWVRGGDSQWARLRFPDGDVADAAAMTRGAVVPLAVGGQLVIAHQTVADRIELTLSVLRSQWIGELGAISVDANPSQPWALVGAGRQAVLLVQQERSRWIWSSMDLHGQVTQPTTPLTEQRPRRFADAAGYLIMVTVLAAMLIMFVLWRRDPGRNRLQLPDALVLADLGRRFVAAAIDMIGPLIIAAVVFDLRPAELIRHWPWPDRSLNEMIPGGLAIGLFVGHSLVTELFTARTLGKALVGLRVTNLAGGPPNVWQGLGRNLMKVFDLIAYPLLILPLIGPNRQRLGDLVARTVVVTAAHEHDDETDTHADQDDTT